MKLQHEELFCKEEVSRQYHTSGGSVTLGLFLGTDKATYKCNMLPIFTW